MAIGSVLGKAVKELPEEFATKADSLPNILKKAGVKGEELEFSKVDLPTKGKVTKSDLEKAVSERKDFFEVVEGSKDYANYSLPQGKANPTYREKILTFKEGSGQAVTALDERKKAVAQKLNQLLTEGSEDYGLIDDLADEIGIPQGVDIEDWLVENLDRLETPGSRYTSSHFPETPNYLMHSRVYDDNFDGVPTRVVQEIQSDLHQAGRQRGYGNTQNETLRLFEDLRIDAMDQEIPTEDIVARAEALGFDTRSVQGATEFEVLGRIEDWATDGVLNHGGGPDAIDSIIPKSPFEKTWLRKGMEREINDALEEGMGQIAIPIKGAVEGLHRGAGVQKWYENVVAKTAQKLAKSKNMDFELVTKSSPNEKGELSFDALNLIENFTIANNDTAEGLALRETYNIDLDNVMQDILDELGPEAAGRVANSTTPRATLIEELTPSESVTYAVIKPKAGKLEPTLDRQAIQAVIDNKAPAPEAIDLSKDPQAILNDLLEEAAPKSKQEQLMDLGLSRSEARGVLLGHKTVDEVVESSMKQTGAEVPNFALYSTPIASAGIVATMLAEGYGQEDVNALLTEEGYDPEEIDEIFSRASAVQTMKAEGYTDEEIQPLLSSEDVNVADVEAKAASILEPRPPGRISDAYRSLVGADELSPKDLLTKMETVYPDMSAVTTNIAGFFGDQESQRITDEAVAASRTRIVDEMAKRGLNVRYDEREGEWIATTEEGEHVVTPEWYRSFWEEKGELVGAIGGAVAGFKAGMSAPVPHPLAKLGLGALGGLVGGAAGAMGGTELDYMHNAMILQQDFEAEVMARKALTAAEKSIIGDVVAAGVFKLGAAGWKGLVKAKDKAHTALKETMFITDEEADALVQKLSKVSDVPGKTPTEKKISAVALTQPGAEDLVRAASATDSTAGQAIAKAIRDRAQDVLDSTKELTDENIGRWLREDLDGYKSLVKADFERAKNAAASAPRANNFRFNYDKLAIDPILDDLGKELVAGSPESMKFLHQAAKIRDMSASRRLPDLIELRKLVNEFKYNKRLKNARTFKQLDGVKQAIDKAIEQGAEATIDNPKAWLKSWRAANDAYSEMKVLEKNVLVKVLTRPGVSEKAIGQALVKYAPALDSTFVEVLAKLPKKSKIQAEGAVLNNLAEKFADGLEGGGRAIHFPAFAKELNQINFTTVEGKRMKQAIVELAEVFKNDLPLAYASGSIKVPQFQSFLTTDPVVRAKFEVASGVFNYIKSLAPTSQGRTLALVRKASKVLENPAHAKSIKELQEAMPEIDLNPLVKAAGQQKATGGGMPRVKLYGDGKVLATKGKGAEQSIPMHLIASSDEVARLAETKGINLADKKAIDAMLKNEGYRAAQLGADKVRLLEK